MARPLFALAAFAALLPLSPAVAAPRTHVVVIDKMKFGPVPQSVRVGDFILWANRDMFRHTATARNGGFHVDLLPNAKVKTMVRARGVTSFYCKYHPGMTGSLKVQ